MRAPVCYGAATVVAEACLERHPKGHPHTEGEAAFSPMLSASGHHIQDSGHSLRTLSLDSMSQHFAIGSSGLFRDGRRIASVQTRGSLGLAELGQDVVAACEARCDAMP